MNMLERLLETTEIDARDVETEQTLLELLGFYLPRSKDIYAASNQTPGFGVHRHLIKRK